MIFENSPIGILSVDLNIRCSRKWAMPETPLGSSAAPTLYQTMCVTTGARWSGMTTTSSPFASVNWMARGAAFGGGGGGDLGERRAAGGGAGGGREAEWSGV